MNLHKDEYAFGVLINDIHEKSNIRSDITVYLVSLSEAIHLSDIIVKSILNKMIESGLVDKYGTGRGQTYILSPNVYKTKEKRIGYVHQVDIDESRYRELILSLAKRNSFISRADVVKLFYVQGEKAYKLLRKLVDDGKLDLVTKGKYAKYQWHKK